MKSHAFNFEGGEHLMQMGASWFVSYCYYTYIDDSHDNWMNVTLNSQRSRSSKFRHTEEYHLSWIKEVLEMSDANLEKNSLGLSAADIKRMAKEVLPYLR